uniref:DUF1990 domain-containing protein n=1 Tax=Leersia perrieri TaxID=77586 RepID=A0A0D9Y0H9_9ORYZ
MAWGGLFLSFSRPSQEQQKSCLAAAGGFNYDAPLHGASKPKSSSKLSAAEATEASDKAFVERGFFVNRRHHIQSCQICTSLLEAGEERFSVQLDEDDQVWYEVMSFSKPAHILSSLCYPYAQLRQRHFAHHSGQAVLRHVASQSKDTR